MGIAESQRPAYLTIATPFSSFSTGWKKRLFEFSVEGPLVVSTTEGTADARSLAGTLAVVAVPALIFFRATEEGRVYIEMERASLNERAEAALTLDRHSINFMLVEVAFLILASGAMMIHKDLCSKAQ